MELSDKPKFNKQEWNQKNKVFTIMISPFRLTIPASIKTKIFPKKLSKRLFNLLRKQALNSKPKTNLSKNTRKK